MHIDLIEGVSIVFDQLTQSNETRSRNSIPTLFGSLCLFLLVFRNRNIRFGGFLGGLALAVVRVLHTVVAVNDPFEKPHEHSSYSFHTYPSCDWNRCVLGVET